MTENPSNPNESPHERFKRLFAEAQDPAKAPPSKAQIFETAPRPPRPAPEVQTGKTEVIPAGVTEQTPVPAAPEDAAANAAAQEMQRRRETEESASSQKTQVPPAPEKPAPPPLGTPPQVAPPALGTHALPLPRRVDQIDPNATRVSASAYANPTQAGNAPLRGREQSGAPGAAARPSPAPVKARVQKPQPGRPRPQPSSRQEDEEASEASSNLGCLLRAAVLATFLLALVGLILVSVAVYQYFSIARTLPDIGELRQRASQFETTRIFDNRGNLLYEILDPNSGRRTYVPLGKISPYMIAATLATEDKDFYSHPGYDPWGIVRAFWQNYTSGEVVSGASTITQQLARTLLFTPEERAQQSYRRKLREAILAAEITRRYTKDEILELYLNEIYFGNLAYGVEAAAQTYFDASAEKLNLEQAAFLAGLPQAPSVYDVYTNRDAAMKRTEQVLYLMFETSKEKGCISVSNHAQPVCVDAVQATVAMDAIKNYTFQKTDIKINHPHWVNYIRSLLEAQYDPQTIYRSGFSVYTTLDPDLQAEAETMVSQQVAALQGMNAHSGALVAIRPTTGEVLAMVGSADYFGDTKTGQVNMAVSPRQPGSSIKPLTYVAAFEKGWTPATLIWDVPTEFPISGDPNDTRAPYVPVNYDGAFHGPVTVRYALANSYNIPAVKALQYVGIYGDPAKPGQSGLVGMAQRLGITTFTREDYGMSLTLGGGEVTLLQLTGAYSVFANGGRRVPPVAITRIVDFNGNEIYRYQPPAGDIVLKPEHAFLISSILSDNQARVASFGANSVLELPFPAAVKTGTTNDFRDNWTIGYTPDLVVGVWVGNPDYTPMVNTTGLTGAAPIWSTFMQMAVPKLTGGNLSNFIRPPEVVEHVICAISGTEPSSWCPQHRNEFFAVHQPPLPKEEDLWHESIVDTWTSLLASRECADYVEAVDTLNVNDVWAIGWLRDDPAGKAWAKQMGFPDPVMFTPSRQCKTSDSRPNLSFAFPRDGEFIKSSPLDIYVTVGATSDFSDYTLYYGTGDDPQNWTALARGNNQYQNPEKIFSWDLSQVSSADVTLRLYITSTRGSYADKRVRVRLQVPTPTTSATPTLTETTTPTPTLPVTDTPTLAPFIPTETPSFTPPPSETPTPPLLPSATVEASPTFDAAAIPTVGQ